MTLENAFLNVLNKKQKERENIVEILHKISYNRSFYINNNNKYDFLKHRLVKMKNGFLEMLEIEKFLPINNKSDELFFTYGVITPIDGKHLTKNNVYLYNNVDASNEVLIKLELKDIKYYSLFPGQIVAIKGTGLENSIINVNEIFSLPFITINDEDENDREKSLLNFKIGIIAGPFMENNEYEMLDKFFMNNFDIAIITGPFYDKLIENIDCDLVFDEIIIPKCEKWLKRSMHSKIIIIPGINDITELEIFPQKPFNKISTDRLIFLSNPSLFSINGIVFGFLNYDILLQLASLELVSENKIKNDSNEDDISCNLYSEDMLRRLATHLVFQKSFLPLLPINEPINYDQPENLDMGLAPEFLITVSKLMSFSKIIGPSNVINLGYQTKTDKKTFAEISIDKTKKSSEGFDFKNCSVVEFKKFTN
ncbi:DNA polymerase alpha subunit B [Gurleya vavrai]